MNRWKLTAIIFIIIASVELITIVGIFKLGYDYIEDENECIYNICEDEQTYYYDYVDSICYCYEDHEVVHQEYIR